MTFRLTRLLNKVPLQTILTIPFVLQVVMAVGIVGYLSFRNGQAAVNSLASQLQNELAARILQQLQSTIERPYVINQINANSLLQEDIDVSTGKGEHQFWQQVKVFTSTNLIYCATETDGAFLGVGHSSKEGENTLQIQVASQETDRFFYYYEVDSTGRRSFLRSKGNKKYDPRNRPWYKAARLDREQTWSDIYLDFDTLRPTITANTPVYSSISSEFIGVCATDIILSKELNEFLSGLDISQSGIAFILEPSGLLIASSTEEPITSGDGENTMLLEAHNSANPLIRGATEYLSQTYQDFDQIESLQLSFLESGESLQDVFHLDGKRQHLQAVRFSDAYGLDWIVVIVVPEEDFMAQINRNTQVTFLLCLVALLVSLLIGLLITRWLTQPLLRLNASAQELAKREWDQDIELERTDVIGDLSRSFSTMARQLQKDFTGLEQRIEERTVELIQLNQELQKMAHVDGLTQTANRRYFDYYLDKEWRHLTRENQPLSLILCDVDYFKKYNDTYGHPQGDICLKQIAQTLTDTVQRGADLVARYGGEEFAIVLSNTDAEGAIKIARRIQSAFQSQNIQHEATEAQHITVSMGIATTTPGPQHTLQSLLESADLALYEAKKQGRNRYCVAS
jgi:diguanylate cyclase (GGDEF)-like protein